MLCCETFLFCELISPNFFTWKLFSSGNQQSAHREREENSETMEFQSSRCRARNLPCFSVSFHLRVVKHLLDDFSPSSPTPTHWKRTFSAYLELIIFTFIVDWFDIGKVWLRSVLRSCRWAMIKAKRFDNMDPIGSLLKNEMFSKPNLYSSANKQNCSVVSTSRISDQKTSSNSS